MELGFEKRWGRDGVWLHGLEKRRWESREGRRTRPLGEKDEREITCLTFGHGLRPVASATGRVGYATHVQSWTRVAYPRTQAKPLTFYVISVWVPWISKYLQQYHWTLSLKYLKLLWMYSQNTVFKQPKLRIVFQTLLIKITCQIHFFFFLTVFSI